MRDALREFIIFAAGIGVGIATSRMLHKKRNRFEFGYDVEDEEVGGQYPVELHDWAKSLYDTTTVWDGELIIGEKQDTLNVDSTKENEKESEKESESVNTKDVVEKGEELQHYVTPRHSGQRPWGSDDWANLLYAKKTNVDTPKENEKESESVSMKDVVKKGDKNVLGRIKKDSPYLITEEEFDDPRYEDYEKIFLTYYADTDDLVDENDETAVINREVYVGTEFTGGFDTSEDPDFVHVRNDMMKLDFEIFKDYLHEDV